MKFKSQNIFCYYIIASFMVGRVRYRWIVAWLDPYTVKDVKKPPIIMLQNVCLFNGLISKLKNSFKF